MLGYETDSANGREGQVVASCKHGRKARNMSTVSETVPPHLCVSDLQNGLLVRGSAVRWGAVLQSGRVRVPIRSLHLF
jgi:hypothetical protein